MPEGSTYVDEVLVRLGDELPDLPVPLLYFYALLVLTKGEEASLEDVHDAWSLWRIREQPGHRSIIPFAELADEVQELDRKYMEGIHVTAAKLKAG